VSATPSVNHLPVVLAASVLFLWFGPASRAQQPPVRQLEQVPPVPESELQPEELREAERSGDLGKEVILEPKRLRMFEAYSGTQYLYNNNVLLAPSERKKDTLLFQTFGASFSPPLIPKLSSAIFFRYQIIRYDDEIKHGTNEVVDLDFDALAGGLSLSYPLQDWLTAYGSWTAQRLTFECEDRSFYKEFDTQLGLRATKPLGRRAAAYCGYQFNWRAVSPAQFNRVENAGYTGINLALVDKLTALLLYRLRFSDYLDVHRNDLDHQVSLTFAYSFHEYVGVRAYALYGNNDSNQSLFDYEVVNAGGGVTLSLRF